MIELPVSPFTADTLMLCGAYYSYSAAIACVLSVTPAIVELTRRFRDAAEAPGKRHPTERGQTMGCSALVLQSAVEVTARLRHDR